MKNILHSVIVLILLVIDLIVMVTANLVTAIVAFVIGLLFLFHYVFALDNKLHAKKD